VFEYRNANGEVTADENGNMEAIVSVDSSYAGKYDFSASGTYTVIDLASKNRSRQTKPE
jgi:hypothetical protein